MHYKKGEMYKTRSGNSYQIPADSEIKQLEDQIGTDTDDKRAVGYICVSSVGKSGDDRFGMDEQRELITDYCDEHGLILCGWYIDSGISADIDNRPGLSSLVYGGPKYPTISHIVCARSDRIAGDIRMYYYLFMVFEKKGVVLVSATEETVDDKTGVGKIYKPMMKFIAEQERKNIGSRTVGGRVHKARSGAYVGGVAPFGYRAMNGKLIIDPEEAEVVRKIFFLYTRGMAANAIANYLNASGVRNRAGNFFDSSRIVLILKREKFYRGYYRYNGTEWVKAEHEPIFPEDDPVIPPNPDTSPESAIRETTGQYPKVLYKLDNDFAISELNKYLKSRN